MYWSGFSIIRWQSSGSLVALRSDLTSCGPSVMLGTKCPSITSTWMMVPPPSAARPTCSPSRAKSADKIEGASSINLGLSGKRMQAEILTRWPCGSDTLVRQRLAALGTVVSAPLVTPRLSKRFKLRPPDINENIVRTDLLHYVERLHCPFFVTQSDCSETFLRIRRHRVSGRQEGSVKTFASRLPVDFPHQPGPVERCFRFFEFPQKS